MANNQSLTNAADLQNAALRQTGANEQTMLCATELQAMLDHRDRQIRAMQQTSEALFSHATADAMIQETLRIAIEVLGADAGSLFVAQPHHGYSYFPPDYRARLGIAERLFHACQSGHRRPRFPVGHSRHDAESV